MGFWGKKKESNTTKCKECGLDLRTPVRLKRHYKKAHGNVPEKKVNPADIGGGTW